jgi:endogenous inhibitor of DNA gyrase (YacG/DUF329 family)
VRIRCPVCKQLTTIEENPHVPFCSEHCKLTGSDFEYLVEEHKKLNNELVIPLFRNFCREYGLNFHFWDELPEGLYDPKIADKEFELVNEAMDLFNRLKPEFSFFRGKIVRFKFTSWDGDFKYVTWVMEEFLELISNELSYLRSLTENILLRYFIRGPKPISKREDDELRKRLNALRLKLSFDQ